MFFSSQVKPDGMVATVYNLPIIYDLRKENEPESIKISYEIHSPKPPGRSTGAGGRPLGDCP
jgi:hypothetical protein